MAVIVTGLPLGLIPANSACGVPVTFQRVHDFIILRNLILNRDIQIRYDSQCARNCLFINIQTDFVAVRQMTDETWIRQFIKNV